MQGEPGVTWLGTKSWPWKYYDVGNEELNKSEQSFVGNEPVKSKDILTRFLLCFWGLRIH